VVLPEKVSKKKKPARQIIRILPHVQGREQAERSEERAEKEWKFQQGNAKKGNGYSGYGNPQKNAERQNPAKISCELLLFYLCWDTLLYESCFSPIAARALRASNRAVLVIWQ
jgi:hypothetical protein